MMMAVLLTSCQDIAPLHEQVFFLDKRADNIEKWLAEIKSEHQRLDALLSSVIDKDHVTSVEISYDEDSSYVVSYTVHFSKSAPITIMVRAVMERTACPVQMESPENREMTANPAGTHIYRWEKRMELTIGKPMGRG